MHFNHNKSNLHDVTQQSTKAIGKQVYPEEQSF